MNWVEEKRFGMTVHTASAGNFSMIITDLRRTPIGRYMCRVDNNITSDINVYMIATLDEAKTKAEINFS